MGSTSPYMGRSWSGSTAKLEDRGLTCMFVGYAEDHSSDCYRMWDPKTNSVHVTRDIIWLRRMFFNKTVFGNDDFIVTLPHPVTSINDGDFAAVDFDDDDASEKNSNIDEENGQNGSVSEAGESGTPHLENDNMVREVVTTTRSGRNVYAPQRLIAPTNFENGLQRLFELSMTNMGMNEVYDVEEMLLSGEMSTTREFGFVGMGIGGGFENTSDLHVLTYEEAMRTANHREWSDAVLEEHERM
jgi:hypothetical protein